jgi:hypothetical protein
MDTVITFAIAFTIICGGISLVLWSLSNFN